MSAAPSGLTNNIDGSLTQGLRHWALLLSALRAWFAQRDEKCSAPVRTFIERVKSHSRLLCHNFVESLRSPTALPSLSANLSKQSLLSLTGNLQAGFFISGRGIPATPAIPLPDAGNSGRRARGRL